MLICEIRKKNISLEGIQKSSLFWIEILDQTNVEYLKQILQSEIVDFLLEEIYFNFPEEEQGVLHISYQRGVTDNPARSLEEALSIYNIKSKVGSGKVYRFLTPHAWSNLNFDQLKEKAQGIFFNPLIEDVFLNPLKSCNLNEPENDLEGFVEEVSFSKMSNFNIQRALGLSKDELFAIENFYQKSSNQKLRIQKGMSAAPTDCELEIIAQSWSEHCKHKIFAAEIDYQEEIEEGLYQKLGSHKIDSLFKTSIKDPSLKIFAEKKLPKALSLFEDNAGVVNFDDQIHVCLKVETHNSPSALDPYGGAITGILGVNRDILGTGMGARPVANLDVFCIPCFDPLDQEQLPLSPAMHLLPDEILKGVHQGVKDGGNKSGIPTVTGAIFEDLSYLAKPLIFVGTLGVLPRQVLDRDQNLMDASQKDLRVGDLIFIVGGAVGRDGIGGATFSSAELKGQMSSQVVQIGDPLTQKRVVDFLLEAQKKGLYTALTDNGAGGLSSSVGEMAQKTNGARLFLDRHPTKALNLKAYEIMLSESQERMTVAVDPNKKKAFVQLAQKMGVSATELGEFTNSGLLEVFFKQEPVAVLPVNFIHTGNPRLKLKAYFKKASNEFNPDLPIKKRMPVDENLKKMLLSLMGSANLGSKKKWVQNYDQHVQAATLIAPFAGENINAPRNGSALWGHSYGGKKEIAYHLGLGMCPRLSLVDPYYMAQMAVDEAIRNIVAQGAKMSEIVLLDNFCWPNPIYSSTNLHGDLRLGELVRAAKGMQEAIEAYATPMISGKDSMKNDYVGSNRLGNKVHLKVLPTLLITSLGTSLVQNLITLDFKKPKDLIYLLSAMPMDKFSLAGSEWEQHFSKEKSEQNTIPYLDLNSCHNLYQLVGQLGQQRLLTACHDISDGGLIVALSEMLLGNGLGAQINLDIQNEAIYGHLFHEGGGRFLCSVDPKNHQEFLNKVDPKFRTYLGFVKDDRMLDLKINGNLAYSISCQEIQRAYERKAHD